MPEYHQIQTYLNIQSSANEIIEHCRPFFSNLGWLNSDLQNWLSGFAWDVAEDGIVYSGANGINIENQFGNQSLKVRISFLGWTPKIIPSLRKNCLEIDLLIETEEIEDQTSWPQIKYLPEKSWIIWELMKKASIHFEDYGVFFTDEAQGNRPWQGILESDVTKMWQFDLAIVNNKYKGLFTPSPLLEYFAKHESNQLWFARRAVWEIPPWS